MTLVAVIVVFLSSRLFYKLYHDISPATRVMSLLAVEFEVFGKVQGVFFRKYTNEKALSLGLMGWVKNTRDGTVRGEMEGETSFVSAMKTWLEKTGSPMSRI